MYSRDLTKEKSIKIPGDDLLNLKNIIEETYQANFIQRNLDFEIYGFIYPQEFVFSICIFNPKDLNATPTSFFCSVDLTDEKPSEKILNSLADYTGVFLDDFFAQDDWEDYFQKWETEKFKDLDIHYKITRENILLSMKAEELLNQ